MKTLDNFYTDGEYLKNNPTWDSEDAPWKAKQLFDLLNKSNIEIQNIKTVSEVGCGSGEVLINFAKLINRKEKKTPLTPLYQREEESQAKEDLKYIGYDLSPDAINIADKNKTKYKLENNFEFKIMSVPDEKSNILICADVFEHIEDEFTFLRNIKGKSEYFLFNIPLDLSVQSMMREHVVLAQRKRVGHVNYYTRSLALETLRDTGYEIIDYTFGPWYKHMAHNSLSTKFINVIRNMLMPIAPEFCVQYFGGSSLVVLAK